MTKISAERTEKLTKDKNRSVYENGGVRGGSSMKGVRKMERRIMICAYSASCAVKQYQEHNSYRNENGNQAWVSEEPINDMMDNLCQKISFEASVEFKFWSK